MSIKSLLLKVNKIKITVITTVLHPRNFDLRGRAVVMHYKVVLKSSYSLMDNLKLDAIGVHKCTLFQIGEELSPIWTKMAGITVRVPLFNAS